ncbi:folate family ECF transporter S component [Petrotoga sp. 9PWA.NaAc.5.4]|uniref:folate family ECF transporter S component n=1 Tax=Petrotoga sp. 9PWA.NaAc.5.4 TaxID=1434328 RepID=UPI000CB4FD45|nr:folate family ECF transporter S component [Petrotoga sp. 9PWA.NaAc.5.4]PNR96293.1 hypothetical protein X924_02860 [Petrotoga sp. 9PWA.NaAc.5.4]
MRKNRTYILILNSLFVVLSILLTRLLSIRIPIGNVEVIRFGFGTIPIYLSSFLFGPLSGTIVGVFEDLLGYWINPIGPFLPQFTLTKALYGLLPGLVFKYGFKKKMTYWTLAISCMMGEIVGITLTPFFINKSFGVPYVVLMPPRLGGFAVLFFLNPFIIKLLLTRIPQLKKLMEESVNG